MSSRIEGNVRAVSAVGTRRVPTLSHERSVKPSILEWWENRPMACPFSRRSPSGTAARPALGLDHVFGRSYNRCAWRKLISKERLMADWSAWQQFPDFKAGRYPEAFGWPWSLRAAASLNR